MPGLNFLTTLAASCSCPIAVLFFGVGWGGGWRSRMRLISHMSSTICSMSSKIDPVSSWSMGFEEEHSAGATSSSSLLRRAACKFMPLTDLAAVGDCLNSFLPAPHASGGQPVLLLASSRPCPQFEPRRRAWTLAKHKKGLEQMDCIQQ